MGSSTRKNVGKKRKSTRPNQYDKHCQKNPSKTLLLFATELPEICIHTEYSRRELRDGKNKQIPKDTQKTTSNLKRSFTNELNHVTNSSNSLIRFKGIHETIPESTPNCRATNKSDRLRKSSKTLRSSCHIKTITSPVGQTQISSRQHFMLGAQRSDLRRNRANTPSKTKHSTKQCSYLRPLINLEICDDKVLEKVASSNHRSTRRIELSKSSPNQHKPSLDHPSRFHNNFNKSNSRNSGRSDRKSRNSNTKECKATLREFFGQRIKHYQEKECIGMGKNSRSQANNSNTFNLDKDIVEMDKENRNERLSSSKAGIFCRKISAGLRQMASNIFDNENIGIALERNANLKFCDSRENPVARNSKTSFNQISTNSFPSTKHGFNQINLTTSRSRADNTTKTLFRKDSSWSSNANVSGFSGEENQNLPNVDRSSPLASDGEETTKHETDTTLPMCLKASEGYHDCRLVEIIDDTLTPTHSSSSNEEGSKKNTKLKSPCKTKNYPTTSHNDNVSDSDESVPTKTLTKQTQFPSLSQEFVLKSTQSKEEGSKVSNSKGKQNINETKPSQNEILEKSAAQELSHGQRIKEATPKKNPARQIVFPESHTKSWVPRPIETLPRRLQGRMSPTGSSTVVRSFVPRPPETRPKKLWDVTKGTSASETISPGMLETEKLVDLAEFTNDKQTQVPSEVFETKQSSTATVKPVLQSINTTPRKPPEKTFSPRHSYLIKKSLTPKPSRKELMDSVKQTLFPSGKLDSSKKVKSLPKPVESSKNDGLLVDPKSESPPKSELSKEKPSPKCLPKPQEVTTPLSTKETPKHKSTELFSRKSDKGDRSVHFECSFHNLESTDDHGRGQNRNLLGCSSFYCRRKNGTDSRSHDKSALGREFYRFFDKNDKENEVIMRILSKQVAEILKGEKGESSGKEPAKDKMTYVTPKKHEHKYSSTTGLGGHSNVQENKNEKGDRSLDYQRIIREEQKTWPKDRMRLIELPATMSQNPSQSHRYLSEQTLILTQASEDCRMPGTCFGTDPTEHIPSKVQSQKNPIQTLQQLETIPKHPQNHHPQNQHPQSHHPQNHHTQIHHIQNHHSQNHHPQNHHTQNHQPANQLPPNSRTGLAPPGIQPMPTISSIQKINLFNPNDQEVAQSTVQRSADFKDAQNDQNGMQIIGPEAFPLEIELEKPGDSVNLIPAYHGNQFCSCCLYCCPSYCRPSCYSWRPGFCSPACSGYCILSPCR